MFIEASRLVFWVGAGPSPQIQDVTKVWHNRVVRAEATLAHGVLDHGDNGTIDPMHPNLFLILNPKRCSCTAAHRARVRQYDHQEVCHTDLLVKLRTESVAVTAC